MRRAVPAVLLLAGVGLGVLAASRAPGRARASFAPLAELAGRAPQSANRVVGQALGVDALDEAALGDELDRAYAGRDADPVAAAYVARVFERLAPHARKPFRYRVHVVRGPPNAMALPGGVLLVTTGLLGLVEDEAELAGVLAHELAHVELSHCLDAAAFRLAARKGGGDAAVVAGVLRDVLVAHAYSQTQEAEADDWAFAVLVDSPYDPDALGDVFARLGAARPEADGPDPFRDYLRSHPPIAQRAAEFRAKGRAWWDGHPDARRLRGAAAFAARRLASPDDPADLRAAR